MFKNNDKEAEAQALQAAQRQNDRFETNISKKKTLKMEEKNFPSLPVGPPPKSQQVEKRKPIMEMLDEDVEESKNAGPAYNPFSGGRDPRPTGGI